MMNCNKHNVRDDNRRRIERDVEAEVIARLSSVHMTRVVPVVAMTTGEARKGSQLI
jgi:hypothetical protein